MLVVGELTVARLKLKGIDGDPHKWWSMWFNSKIREEPYLALTLIEFSRDGEVPFGEHENRCCRDCLRKEEEGEDDVKSSWPLWLGLHTCYNGAYRELRYREVEPIS